VRRQWSEDERRAPLRALLAEALPDQDAATNAEVAELPGTALRDHLIAHSPLDREWIARVNQVGLFACPVLRMPLPGLRVGMHAVPGLALCVPVSPHDLPGS
jgi:hypothetical protein